MDTVSREITRLRDQVSAGGGVWRWRQVRGWSVEVVVCGGGGGLQWRDMKGY